jgi:GT2 family glycosyltransferase
VQDASLDLTVVILNWNTRDLLKDSLQSLVCAAIEIEMQVVVVDNASSDDSREMVRELFPEVTLIANSVNTGFGAGNNLALGTAVGRYVMFLNSDTVVTEGALDKMVRYADDNPDIGIVGPKLLNGDGSLQYSCRSYPNLGTGFFRNTPLGRLFPNNRFTNDYLLTDYDHNAPRDVDWLSGAALMMRKSLIDEIGAFDEEYYMFCEDVDLCWRVNHTSISNELRSASQKTSELAGDKPRATWRVSYFPESVIYHLIGKSTDLAPTRMTYEFHRSQHLFYKKHYAHETPMLIRPIIPFGIWLRAVGKMARYRVRKIQRWISGQDRKTRGKGKRN